VKQAGRPLAYDEIFEAWPLLEADFHEAFGVDLETVFWVKSWRWFAVRVDGLLASDSRIHRHFSDEPEGVTDGGGISDNGGFDRWEAEPGQVPVGPAAG
jgi:hypothetical protein